MTEERDRIYRDAQAAAVAEFDELEPMLKQLQSRANSLKLIIKGCAEVRGIDYVNLIDDKYKFMPRSQFTQRPVLAANRHDAGRQGHKR